MTTEELRDERTRLEAEAEEILSRSESNLDGPDLHRFDQVTARLGEVNDLLERRRVLAETLTRGNVTTDTGDGAAGYGRSVALVRRRDGGEIHDRSDLHVEDAADGSAYRDRAMRAIEGWPTSIPAEWRESAEHLVADAERSPRDRAVADHLLLTGHPDYVEGWHALMSHPERMAFLPEHQRAALNEGSNSQGGFLVPPYLDPTIILSNVGVENPFRTISTVTSITTQTWKGITSAGVTAEWTAEAAEMTDASPTVAQPTITPVRADAFVQASWEVFEDTNIGRDLAMLFADARDRLEGTAFAVGTGSTQPFGVVTELQLVTASRVDANTNGAYGVVDVYAMDNALPARWRRNASWVANKAYWNRTRQFATGSGPQSAFWTDLGGGQPPLLLGYPVYDSSDMQSTLSSATASNDDVIILADWRSGFRIVDRVGMSIASTQWIMGSNRRPTGEWGFVAYWRTSSRVLVADAFRMLRV